MSNEVILCHDIVTLHENERELKSALRASSNERPNIVVFLRDMPGFPWMKKKHISQSFSYMLSLQIEH